MATAAQLAKPIAITMGDPAGIGPEALLSRMAAASSEDVHRLLVDKIRQSGPSRVAPEDLATLTLSILDGLTVLAERGDNQQRAERAFEAFLTLLDCSQSA